MAQGILPRHFFGGLITILILFSAAIAIEASDNSTVNFNSNQSITAFTICKKVTNNSGTGLNVYVPTQSSAEWSSFYTNPPAGVSIASCVTAGSQTYATPGTYSFTVPAYNTMTVELWGGGGGGAGQQGGSFPSGGSGGTSQWDGETMQATGGAGGSGHFGGGAGSGSGGTTNLTGNGGSTASQPWTGGSGGAGANGGSGGSGSYNSNGSSGASPGGGGGGGGEWVKGSVPGGGGGGGGGYASRTYSSVSYTPESSISVVVGSYGGGGGGNRSGGSGGNGQVIITWQ